MSGDLRRGRKPRATRQRRRRQTRIPSFWRLVLLCLVAASATLAIPPPQEARAAGPVSLATSSHSFALQHPAQDKVAYLHDGSLLVSYFDGRKAVIDQVKNPSTSPSVLQVQTISGDEVTLYTQPGAGSTDIWIQVGAELVGSAPLEQIQHGVYDGSSFSWDTATAIPGTTAPGHQDPSVTWTGKWLIATWWDDVNFSNSDNVYMNWTADRTGKTGWLSTSIHMTTTNVNITQPNIRHSAKLGATVLVYGTHYRDLYRVLPDSRTDPSLANWTAERVVDPGFDDSEAGFGGPQVAIDESTGKIHVFRAVLNAGGPTWHGVTYWLGTPDAVPMVTGNITWNPRLIIDASASPAPVDIAGAVDSSGKVYVFWVTGASSGTLKYSTLTSPYTSASAADTLTTTGSQPRYPHIPAQAPLSRGYVPVLYQTGTGSPYSIVLDTTILAAGADTSSPTVPTGLTATTSLTLPRVNLTWSASTDNVAVTGYTVYRNGSPLASVSGSTLAYADNTVTSLTTYIYSVDAFDAAGNHSARSATVSVTTPDTSPPTVPAGLSANAVSPGEIDLSWNASTDNLGVTGYTVYRNGTYLTATAAGVTTWADTSVVASTAYSYTVDAFDAAGNYSARSAAASATTPGAPDTQPPTAPAGVTATVGSTVGEVDVAWNAATDNLGVTGYTIYRDGSALGTVSGSTLAYADRTTAGLTPYSYTVDAFDAAGNHSAQSLGASVTTPDWTAPTVPTGLTATLISNDEIDLTWNASTDDVAVTGYTMYRNGVAVAITAAGTLSYANTGLGHGFAYTYTVDAFDAAGNHSVQSAPASASTTDDIPPATPGGFAATGTSPTAVGVSWSASTDNVAVTGYGVYRDSALLITLGPSTFSYTDTVATGSTHSYTVDAFDAAGNHSGSPTAISVTTSTAVTVPKFAQGAVTTSGSRVTSVTMTLGPVAQGDLLVGWFGQYDSAGQVNVSDNVHGAWTRSASTTWRGGSTTPGDIALYYLANAGGAPSGITITITSSGATYLQAAASEYSGVAAVNPLDQVVVAKGSGITAASGLTVALGPGELVYGGMTATNNAGTLTPGTSQGVAFVKRAQSSSGTQGDEDIVSGAAGQQQAVFSFATSVPWFIVCAVFKPA